MSAALAERSTEPTPMRGLMADRFLRRFVDSLKRQRKPVAPEAEAASNECERHKQERTRRKEETAQTDQSDRANPVDQQPN